MKWRDLFRYVGFLGLFSVIDLALAWATGEPASHADMTEFAMLCVLLWAIRETKP